MSIGGFLGPVLAGLTGYAEQQKQAEQNRIRQQEAQVRQAMFQNYLKQQQDTQAAESGFFNALSGGGGGNLSGLGQIAKPQPVGGGPTTDMSPEAGGGFSMGADSPTRTPGKGFGGSAGAGHINYGRTGALGDPRSAGWDQQNLVAVNAPSGASFRVNRAAAEDFTGFLKDLEDAGYQIDPSQSGGHNLRNITGGSGLSEHAYGTAIDINSGRNPYSKEGRKVTDLPANVGELAAKHNLEWGGNWKSPVDTMHFQWRGPRAEASQGGPDTVVGGSPGVGGVERASFSRATPDGDGATAPMAQPEIPPDMQKEARQVEVKVAQAVDPMARGKMSLEGLAKSIERSMPGASPHAKFLALEKLQKFMAPIEQERRQQDMEMLREKFRQEMQDRTFRQQNDMQDKRQRGADDRADQRAGQQSERDRRLQQERLEREGWSIETDADGTRYRYNKITGQARPLTGAGEYSPQTAQPKQGAAVKSRNIEVMDGEGKVIFRGAARQGPQGWIADKDNKPVEIPEDGNIRISSTSGGPGKQAAAQLNRVIAAGNELSGAMRDLLELPSGSVAGVFQGLQAMPADSLGEAMKRSLANKLTDEAASDVKIGFQGVARFVASLEAFGAATGLVGLTKSAEVYMPQTGDTMGNVLRKYATLRRDAERALEAGAASPDVGQEQKKLIDKVRKELTEAVPFTVSDVNKLQHGDAETYRDVAKKLLGGGGSEKGGGNPDTSGPYKQGQTIWKGGRQYRALSDGADPDVEPVQ